MIKLGLIGYPLSHTFSPGYFREKFEKENIKGVSYEAFSIPHVQDFLGLIRDGVSGLNVTIPYKEKVIPFLDTLDATASAVGAVNTILLVDGKLVGYNTDVIGFEHSINKLIVNMLSPSCLILGTGGAAKAVAYVMDKQQISYKYVSRSAGDIRYNDLDKDIINSHHLIVNTTPLGMYPNIEQCPEIPFQHVTDKHCAYDLVYNPKKTLFLKRMESHGATIKNGLDMLTLQAEASWQIWTSKLNGLTD